MPTYNIVVFGGDHCGPEVVAEGIKILKVIEAESKDIKFTFSEQLLGGASIDATGSPLTDEALEAARNADAILLGAIGGPKWGTGAVRPEQGILKLRKELQTFGNLRPCFFASESLLDSSPLKAEVARGVNFNIIRELTGGIYFGERTEDDGSGYACDTEPYSRAEIERVGRLAAHLALAESPPAPVWSLDKANVLATSRLWRKTMTGLFEKEFPQLKLGHHLIDSAAMLMVKNPRALNGVIVTSNLFGDIISDEASVIPGSLGLLPSASLSSLPDGKGKCNGIYEPIHGKYKPEGGCLQDYGTNVFYRFGTRYLGPEEGQPDRHHPLGLDDAQVLLQSTQACDRRGRSCAESDRCWSPDRGHWRIGFDFRGRRRGR